MSDQRGDRGVCRSCGAQVLWVETESGKRMPLDAIPERRFVLDATVTPMRAKQRNAYVSHFSSCPSADQWRKGKDDG